MGSGRQNAITQIIIYSRHKSFEIILTLSTYKALRMFKAPVVMFMSKMFELPIIINKQGNCIAGSFFFQL